MIIKFIYPMNNEQQLVGRFINKINFTPEWLMEWNMIQSH